MRWVGLLLLVGLVTVATNTVMNDTSVDAGRRTRLMSAFHAYVRALEVDTEVLARHELLRESGVIARVWWCLKKVWMLCRCAHAICCSFRFHLSLYGGGVRLSCVKLCNNFGRSTGSAFTLFDHSVRIPCQLDGWTSVWGYKTYLWYPWAWTPVLVQWALHRQAVHVVAHFFHIKVSIISTSVMGCCFVDEAGQMCPRTLFLQSEEPEIQGGSEISQQRFSVCLSVITVFSHTHLSRLFQFH